MEIIQEVKSLNLPEGRYAVFGSGPMQVHGIRPASDIDILALPELYDELKRQGWNESTWEPPYPSDYLRRDNFQIVKNWNYGEYNPDPKELIDKAEIVGGVPFVPLEEVLQWKRAFRRERDQEDIRLIEEYLNK